jgi:hypothetical protein
MLFAITLILVVDQILQYYTQPNALQALPLAVIEMVYGRTKEGFSTATPS